MEENIHEVYWERIRVIQDQLREIQKQMIVVQMEMTDFINNLDIQKKKKVPPLKLIFYQGES